MKYISLIFILLLPVSFSYAQEKTTHSTDATAGQWYLADPADDNIPGISMQKALQYLKGRTTKTVVVAVIDSGVDVDHDDITENIWENTGEIPDNGIDDDHNGYVDDIHGWNFIGREDGENISGESLEYTRIFAAYDEKYSKVERRDLPKGERKDYDLYLKVKDIYLSELEKANNNLQVYKVFRHKYTAAHSYIAAVLNKDDYTKEEVEAISPENENIDWAKRFIIAMKNDNITLLNIDQWISNVQSRLDTKLNRDNMPRLTIGDDLTDITDSIYGNNDYNGGTASHGTSVAGVIGALGGNGMGIDGIGGDVKIMVVRVVPGGDEYDKDVALGIRYAVNNGAQIINCSFGKMFSPQKEMVDDAIRYAEKRGVLIIHAAGNEGLNNDKNPRYPTKRFNDNDEANNFIDVGASGSFIGSALPASFSNYGKKSVDLFAPGANITSLAPGNRTSSPSGTSMAAPVVTGVAAMLLSYFPELSAVELKEILLASVYDVGSVKVSIPGEAKKKTKFKKICKTGGIVNAYSAVKMADERTSQGLQSKE